MQILAPGTKCDKCILVLENMYAEYPVFTDLLTAESGSTGPDKSFNRQLKTL